MTVCIGRRSMDNTLHWKGEKPNIIWIISTFVGRIGTKKFYVQ